MFLLETFSFHCTPDNSSTQGGSRASRVDGSVPVGKEPGTRPFLYCRRSQVPGAISLWNFGKIVPKKAFIKHEKAPTITIGAFKICSLHENLNARLDSQYYRTIFSIHSPRMISRISEASLKKDRLVPCLKEISKNFIIPLLKLTFLLIGMNLLIA